MGELPKKGRPRSQSSVIKHPLELDIPVQLTQVKRTETAPVDPSPNTTQDKAQELHLKAAPLNENMTFAYFRKFDIKPRRQRQLLYAVQIRRMEIKDKHDADEQFTPKSGIAQNKTSNVLMKLNSLLKTKKKKKKTRNGILHQLQMAIQDRRIIQACTLIEELKSNSLKNKRLRESNKAFLSALANRLDPACVMLLDKGFPKNINASIHGDEKRQTDKLLLPSYFMLTVAFGSDALFKSMIKVYRVNLY